MHRRIAEGKRAARLRVGVVAWLAAASTVGACAAELPAYRVLGDSIPASLTGVPGNPDRGRAIVTNRQSGLCLLCHAGPFPEERQQGTLAPDLTGIGARLSEGQLRLRVVDARRLNSSSTMPAYFRSDNLTRVARAWQSKPVLTAQEIEDVVALLRTLDK